MNFEQTVKDSCPHCFRYGKLSGLVFVYYKEDEAFYTCEDKNCIYFVTDTYGNPIKYKLDEVKKILIPQHSNELETQGHFVPEPPTGKNQIDPDSEETFRQLETTHSSQDRREKSPSAINTFDNNLSLKETYPKHEQDVNSFDAEDFFKTDDFLTNCNNENMDFDDSFLNDFVIN